MSYQDVEPILKGIATVIWPIIFIGLLFYFRNELKRILKNAGEFSLEVPGGKFRIKPSTPPRTPDDPRLPSPKPDTPLPFDYLYLNHTSFLRPEKQAEFQKRTGVPLPHYDIRVIVDSYYDGALQRIERVDYILDRSFPHPTQVRERAGDRFLLKELANGEFVIQAKVFLVGSKTPILLQRYLTLWKEGPRLDSGKQSQTS